MSLCELFSSCSSVLGKRCLLYFMRRIYEHVLVGEGNSSNEMGNVEIFMHNGLLDVVPTSLCGIWYIEMELMFAPLKSALL